VAPVKVSALPSELGLPVDVVASKVRDQLERALAEEPSLLVVNRSELNEVLTEQQLAASPLFNAELAPTVGKLIPAQMLLVANVERVDLKTTTEKQTSDTTERYYKQALELERQAESAQRESDRLSAEGPRKGFLDALASAVPCVDRSSSCFQSDPAARSYCQQIAQNNYANCQRQKNESEARAREQAERSWRMKVEQERSKSQRLMSEARHLRETAMIEAKKDVKEVHSTEAKAVLLWKALDVATGAVLATASAESVDRAKKEGTSTESAFASESKTSSSRHDVLVNRLLSSVVAKAAGGVVERLEQEPLRAKIVKVDSTGVVVNCGNNQGVAVGDTFGVRKRREILTDPDTGEPLETPGEPLGVIRVSEVFEKTAFAQVVGSAGSIRRGDELEWIGVYKVIED
jgi:hypothetical protein